MKETTQDDVRKEVEGLHRFFVGWFTGSLKEDAIESDFLPRLSSDLVFIPPAGKLLGIDNLASSIRRGYGTNPDFRIQIRNVNIHMQCDSHLVATYEEWQRNARASTPPDNGRIATVIFARNERLTWRYIHETWLPPDTIKAGPYDF